MCLYSHTYTKNTNIALPMHYLHNILKVSLTAKNNSWNPLKTYNEWNKYQVSKTEEKLLFLYRQNWSSKFNTCDLDLLHKMAYFKPRIFTWFSNYLLFKEITTIHETSAKRDPVVLEHTSFVRLDWNPHKT